MQNADHDRGLVAPILASQIAIWLLSILTAVQALLHLGLLWGILFSFFVLLGATAIHVSLSLLSAATFDPPVALPPATKATERKLGKLKSWFPSRIVPHAGRRRATVGAISAANDDWDDCA